MLTLYLGRAEDCDEDDDEKENDYRKKQENSLIDTPSYNEEEWRRRMSYGQYQGSDGYGFYEGYDATAEDDYDDDYDDDDN